jgi:hypothetical protein
MGIANSDIIKGAVDFLTWIMNGINKLTTAISGDNGIVKAILSLGLAIGGLKIGKKLLGGGLEWVGKKFQLGAESAVKKGSTVKDAEENASTMAGAMKRKFLEVKKFLQEVFRDAAEDGTRAGM